MIKPTYREQICSKILRLERKLEQERSKNGRKMLRGKIAELEEERDLEEVRNLPDGLPDHV